MRADPVWHRVGHCECLVVVGGDPWKLEDRIAFIEKTPRVRIRHMERRDGITYGGMDPHTPPELSDWLNWASGAKGRGPDDTSRKWCVDMLKLLGWEFPSEV